jgi:hypothetical protein
MPTSNPVAYYEKYVMVLVEKVLYLWVLLKDPTWVESYFEAGLFGSTAVNSCLDKHSSLLLKKHVVFARKSPVLEDIGE